MSALSDAQTALVGRIRDAMTDADPTQWARPWADIVGTDGLPYNAATGQRYAGQNVWHCLLSVIDHAYSRNAFATYKQWQSVGAQVRRGQRGTTICRFGTYTRTDKQTGETSTGQFAKGYTVFNLDQVDIVDAERFRDTAHCHAGAPAHHDWLSSVPARVCEGSAAYSPADDVVTMPHSDAFANADEYWSTLAHELTHWTGHPSRLDRRQSTDPRSSAYAFEELVAELGAVFICADIGIDPVTRDDHAQYLRHWSDAMGADPRVFMRAATKASDAFAFLAQWRTTTD